MAKEELLYTIFTKGEIETFLHALRNYAMYEGEATPLERQLVRKLELALPYPGPADDRIRTLEIELELEQMREKSDLALKMTGVLAGRWCIDEIGWSATAETLMPPLGMVTYFQFWALSLTDAIEGAVNKATSAYREAEAKEKAENEQNGA